MYNQIIKMFKLLPLEGKEQLLKELEEITEEERKLPEKSELEEAWEDIRRDIFSLSCEPYIDDQWELEDVYEICERSAKGGKLPDEKWNVRAAILLEIIKNNTFSDYSLEEPMEMLMDAMFTTPEDCRKAGALIDEYGNQYMWRYSAELYKKAGDLQRYYDYLEDHLDNSAELQKDYLLLIRYYRSFDEEKAKELADQGLKKLKRDTTDLMIYLMQWAYENNDEKRFKNLLRRAKRRNGVNDRRVKEYLATLEEDYEY